jgi:UDP-N-acetylglucosamine:LPS N-acetylglucosamine transferase
MPTHDIARDLRKIFQTDRRLLAQSELPIITVSASFREDLKGLHRQKESDKSTDIVLSRAHYSMAMGVAMQAWGDRIDPKKAWLVDSTNYVGTEALRGVALTHQIGKLIARFNILKTLKDLVDKFGRSKMPILDHVTPPTIYLGSAITGNILSMHIVTGNILAAEGKKVVQMITDPHVRSDYLANAHLPNMRFLVFDEATKTEFFTVAKKIGKKIPADQIKTKVTVTGPPIDPRIIACSAGKSTWTAARPLVICLATGGLGTNKEEIKQILQQLLPELRAQESKQTSLLPDTRLIFYAGTHKDHLDMALKIAKENNLTAQVISPKDPANFVMRNKIKQPEKVELNKRFTILYHPQIVDANELFIQYGFPNADIMISKPSGDTAYDAVVSGAALLTLKEWGDWEHNVRERFEKNGTSQTAQTDDIVAQLVEITREENADFAMKKLNSSVVPAAALEAKNATSWVAKAMRRAKNLDSIFYEGAKNIIEAVKNQN